MRNIDNQKLTLTLDLPPSVNHIYGRNRFGGTYLMKCGKDFKEKSIKYIVKEVENQNWVKTLENQYIFLDKVVFMNKKSRDADNILKLLQDSITESKVVWVDDTYCLPRTHRVYIDSDNPRVEFTLTVANYIGIFNNKEELEQFINTYCKNCKKGKKIGQKGGCTIYKEALENRIKPSIILDENKKWKCVELKIANRNKK